MFTVTSISADVERAASVLKRGGVVALPTETVYGLGASAFDPQAVARVFEIKGRPRFDPLIVHIADVSWIEQVAAEFSATAQLLARHFWPGPLSLVLPKTQRVPDLVTSGLPSVAIRIPNHPMALELLQTAQVPVAAPSANLFGRLSPTTAEHVVEQLGDQVDCILDGGPCSVGVESTVLQLGDGLPRLLRPGGVSLEELEQLIGEISVVPSTDNPGNSPAVSPGMLPQHYAPQTPLRVQSNATPPASGQRVGLLAFCRPVDEAAFTHVELLSEAGDLREAAAQFFGALRRLDARGLDLIIAHGFPECGLGRALNDRLRRASGRDIGDLSQTEESWISRG